MSKFKLNSRYKFGAKSVERGSLVPRAPRSACLSADHPVARQGRSRPHIKLRSFPFIDAIIAHIYINIQECKQLKEAGKFT